MRFKIGPFLVKIGKIGLTDIIKIEYNLYMVGSAIIFVLRICLVAVVWVLVWRLIEPKTKEARVLRAAILVASLLVILVVIRVFSA